MRVVKRILIIIAVLVLVSSAFASEEKQELATGYVTNGMHQESFQYPKSYEIEDEGDIGTYVYLNKTDWVSISIPKQGLSGVKQLHENIGNEEYIIALADNLHVFATHGDEHQLPFTRSCDIVEVGVNLPNGTGLIVNAYCLYGQAEIYDLLLTILGSMTEIKQLENWLFQEWIPYVSQ